MARVERHEDGKGLRKEITKAVKHAGKHHGSPLGCCALAAFTVVMIIFLWCIWCLAATGFATVPLISSMAYEPPVPTRAVTPSGSLAEMLGGISETPGAIRVTEGVLTAGLRQAMEGADVGPFDMDSAQIAVIEGEGLEIFLPFATADNDNAAVVLATLEAGEDGIGVEIVELRAGSSSLPGFLAGMAEPAASALVEQLEAQLPGGVRMSDITYQDGALLVTLEARERP